MAIFSEILPIFALCNQKPLLMRKFYLFISLFLLSAIGASAQLEWKSIGYATVVDGWITPGYVDDDGNQIDPNTCPMQVAVEVPSVTVMVQLPEEMAVTMPLALTLATPSSSLLQV